MPLLYFVPVLGTFFACELWLLQEGKVRLRALGTVPQMEHHTTVLLCFVVFDRVSLRKPGPLELVILLHQFQILDLIKKLVEAGCGSLGHSDHHLSFAVCGPKGTEKTVTGI